MDVDLDFKTVGNLTGYIRKYNKIYLHLFSKLLVKLNKFNIIYSYTIVIKYILTIIWIRKF